MKKSFLIFSDCLPAVETLGDAAAGVLFKMLLRYSETGEKPDNIPTILQFPFMSFVAQIERNRDKYLAVCEKRKEAIKKRWSKEKSIQMNTNEYKRTQVNTSDSDSVSDSDSGNISNLSVTMDSSLSSSLHSEDSIIKGTNVPTSSDDDARLVLTPPNGDCESKKDYSYKVMKFWNNVMKSPVAIPTIAKMTPKRKTVVNARVKEFGINAVYQAISKASESSFLNGGGSKGFLADFDWVFRPNNFPKVLEGNYDDVKPINKNGNGTNERDKSREQREADLLAKERLEFIATKYGDIG